MRMANDQFTNKFRYYLRRTGYNQRELAHELNVDASTFSRWVNGDNPWPVDALTRVCEELELDQENQQELFVLAGLDTLTVLRFLRACPPFRFHSSWRSCPHCQLR